jgi:type IV pilus assembly protein PilW
MKLFAIEHRRRNQLGLTLIELLVALVMGLVLLGGVVTVFIANKQTYKYQESLARLQENGRFALELMARDIRGAGYTGCGGRSAKVKNTVNQTNAILYSFGDAVNGFDSRAVDYSTAAATPTNDGTKWSPSLDTSIFPSARLPIANSDVIVARVVDPTRCKVDKHNVESATFFTTPCDLKNNEIVMVTDCSNAAILQIDNTTGLPQGGSDKTLVVHNAGVGGQTPGNWTKDLGHNYARNGGMFKISTYIYYVGDTGRGVSGAPMLALYRLDDSGVADELVEGVENLQILYGLDTDQNMSANQYVPASDVPITSWGEIRSVRISLLLRSPAQNVLNAKQQISLNYDTAEGGGYLNAVWSSTTTPIPTADRSWRQIYTTTINLRNRSS